MSFLDDYETVADRREKYWAAFPTGSILTAMIERTDSSVTFKASVYDGDRLIATGWASETVTDRGVNATSALENCETSAVGRALANAGFSAKTRPREEKTEEAVLTPKQVQARIKQALRKRFPDWPPATLDHQAEILYRPALKALEITAPTPSNVESIVGASLDLAEMARR